MNIIAIDPGKQCGVALFRKGKLYTSLSLNLDDPYAISSLRSTLRKKMGAAFVVVAERGGWRSMPNAYYVGVSLGYLLGGTELPRPHHYVEPAKWRQAVLGKGRITKPEVVSWVQTNAKKSVEDHNEAEAICIGYYFLWRHAGEGRGSQETLCVE